MSDGTETGPMTVSFDTTGVAQVTLTRPAAHNAMDAAMIADLHRFAEDARTDASLRVIVLTGAGGSFCAGADLGWMRAQITAPVRDRVASARALAAMLAAWEALPQPVIARVNGAAFGGGVGLLSVCDLGIGVETAAFGLTETRLGLIPATIGPYLLRRIGPVAARRLILSGRRFDAAEAVRIGLLSAVVTPEALDAAVAAEVAAHLAAAPGALAAAKRQIQRFAGPVSEAEIAQSIDDLVARWADPESAEGIAAFFARRPPLWRGETDRD